jgi:hypothetical protein
MPGLLQESVRYPETGCNPGLALYTENRLESKIDPGLQQRVKITQLLIRGWVKNTRRSGGVGNVSSSTASSLENLYNEISK